MNVFINRGQGRTGETMNRIIDGPMTPPVTAGCDERNAKAMRSKTWDECGIEEKVERIRDELVRQREVAEYAARNANQALELAHRHIHIQTGEVMVPADDRRNRVLGGAEASSRSFDPLR